MKSPTNRTVRSVLFLILMLLSSCRISGDERMTLRLALLPILDSLPVHVALQEGFFEDQNLKVEIIPVSSAPERDQLIAAGKAEGMINELVSVMFFNRDVERVQIIRTARAATRDNPVFRILASKDANISTAGDLKGVQIGISEGTVIEYLTDRMLIAEGLEPQEINKVAVPRIPDRLALLSSGELPAAILPDPLASLAIQNGAVVIIDDSQYPEFGLSVYSFRIEYIKQHPDAIKGFLQAIENAVWEINNNPEKYANLLAEQELVPDQLIDDYQVPPFPTASVPNEDQWMDALAWALEKQLLDAELAYKDSVVDQYLPGN